jgi:hypothetical protein
VVTTGGGDIIAEAIIAAGAILTDGAVADAWAFISTRRVRS